MKSTATTSCPSDSKTNLQLSTSNGEGSKGTCVFPWTYDDVEFTTCADLDNYGGVGWCSFDRKYKGNWGYCTETCPSMFTYSILQVHYYISVLLVKPRSTVDNRNIPFSECPADSKTNLGLTSSKGDGQTGACVFPFEYDGTATNKCLSKQDYGGVGWCSLDKIYDGRWGYCKADQCPSMFF